MIFKFQNKISLKIFFLNKNRQNDGSPTSGSCEGVIFFFTKTAI